MNHSRGWPVYTTKMGVLLSLLACVLTVGQPASASNHEPARQRKPKGPSLAVYLQKHPWDAAQKGSMLALEPESAIAADDGSTLGSFGRQEFKVGGITAIAPSEMVY